jgi:hypothetical protein
MSRGPTDNGRRYVREHRDECIKAVWKALVHHAGSVEAADDLAASWYEFFQEAMENRTQSLLPISREEERKQAPARIWALYQLAENIVAENMDALVRRKEGIQ